MRNEIIFQNDNWVVVNKPAGVLTTPSRHQKEDNRQCLGLSLQDQLKKQIFPIHRLDFEVSGLVLFALNAKSHALGNFWFETKLVKKTYHALTQGEPEENWAVGEKVIWKNKLLRGKRRAYVSPAGKLSETEAIWQGWKDERMHWHLHPLTGRPHQLRVHLSQHGFPIVGDELYGSTINYRPNEIALRAVSLDFTAVPEDKRAGIPALIILY